VRALAILAVIVFHGFTFSSGNESGEIDRFSNLLAGCGWLGVDLFFVISGFLITSILLRAKGNPNAARNFYIRRVLRIFPLYYAFIAVAIALTGVLPLGLTGSYQSQLWNVTYLNNVGLVFRGFDAIGGFFHHFWSLAIEEQYYLFWPWLILFTRRKTAARTCVGLFAASIVARCVAVSTLGSYAGYMLTPARLDGLVCGSLLALALPEIERQLTRRSWIFVAGAISFCALFALRGGLSVEDKFVVVIAPALAAIVFTAILGKVLLSRKQHRFLELTPLRLIGRYSYAMYVFHVPLINLLILSGLPRGRILGMSLPYQIAFTGLVTVASFAVAAVSWHVFEKHFIALKERMAPTLGAVAQAAQ
jgi:peptidoglycan/LPS O-acetylase OafA/YrhL